MNVLFRFDDQLSKVSLNIYERIYLIFLVVSSLVSTDIKVLANPTRKVDYLLCLEIVLA